MPSLPPRQSDGFKRSFSMSMLIILICKISYYRNFLKTLKQTISGKLQAPVVVCRVMFQCGRG